MGILSRFGEIMESNINALLDKAEDPVEMTDQMLRKLNEDLAKVKEETAAVMAEETSAKRRVDELQGKVNEFSSSVRKALQSGNEEDARTLLARKQEFESQLATATNTYNAAKQNSENMQAMYNKLSADIVTLNGRRENVKAQMAMADAQERANKITSRMGSTDAGSTFARMEERAQERLDKAVATSKLNGGVGAVTDKATELNNKYSAGSGASVDAELEAMKKDLGMV